MSSIGMQVDIATLIDAAIAGDTSRIAEAGRDLLQHDAHATELIGRIGMIAAHGDSEGHAILTLSAASMIARWFIALPALPEQEPGNHERELPLLVQALAATTSAIQVGKGARDSYPEPLFPSELAEGQSVSQLMHDAIYKNDPLQAERLLFGLYGTGADYRTMEVRTYDSISTTFQQGGHSLLFAVRGFQLLDAVEWGDRAPHILHWLASFLPIKEEEPDWVKIVRSFITDPSRSLESLRTRLSPPKNEQALPLRELILSNADTAQVCQGVYNALIKGGASPRGVGSVISLAASDLLQTVGDTDRDMFMQAAHGLLFSSAARTVFAQVQDIEAVPLLFTAAAFINALQKELVAKVDRAQPVSASTSLLAGGGLIATTLLETLTEQIAKRDPSGAFSTARRYLKLGYDVHALFATIGLAAAQLEASLDHGHALQIVLAAGEEYLAWPHTLADTTYDGFVLAALRAVIFAKRNTLVTNL